MSLQVHEVWDSVAAAWEAEALAIEEQSEPFTRALVDRLAVSRGDRLLELASGPGNLGEMWSGLVGAAGRVLLTDVSPAMIAAAARRNSAFENVETMVLDAGAIDLPDNSFETVVCRMGLMFVPDPATTFADIHRVLVPGGRFATATWGGPQHNAWITCLGLPVTDGPGVFSLSDPEHITTLMTQAGFVEVTIDEVDLAFRTATIDDHVRQITSLAPIPPGVQPQVADPWRYSTGDGVAFPARALVVSGRHT